MFNVKQLSVTKRRMLMSHDLEIYDGEASFAYNGAKSPWHRLGVKMDGLRTADEMLVAARANYTVSAEPLYVFTEAGSVMVEGRVATVRTGGSSEDASGAESVLGIVGDGYQIIQNAEVLNRALAIVGAGGEAVVDTCGVLGNGERFFAYVDLGAVSIDPSGINDRITRGLGVLTSHDGTAAITYAMSNIRWVCQNTVTAGIKSSDRVFRARHTTNVEAALADAYKVLGLSESWEKSFSSLANRLLRVNDGGSKGLAHDLLGRVERSLWPQADEPTNHARTIAEGRSERLHALLDSKTCGENFGYNGWSVYNAFVEYSDHLRPRLSDERRAEAVVLGATDDWKDKVADLILV